MDGLVFINFIFIDGVTSDLDIVVFVDLLDNNGVSGFIGTSDVECDDRDVSNLIGVKCVSDLTGVKCVSDLTGDEDARDLDGFKDESDVYELNIERILV